MAIHKPLFLSFLVFDFLLLVSDSEGVVAENIKNQAPSLPPIPAHPKPSISPPPQSPPPPLTSSSPPPPPPPTPSPPSPPTSSSPPPPPPPTPSPPPPSNPKQIDCGSLCKVRCQLASRQKMCTRACQTCCGRCNCVPGGTSGHYFDCICYGKMTTHSGHRKCP